MRRYKILATVAVFAGINVAGLTWIHHDLTQASKTTVRVLSASLLPDVDNPDRITVIFDRDMVAEAGVGRIEAAPVFSLAPVWPGKWVWSAREKLEYLLDKPLPAGCRMSLAATDRLKEATGKILDGATEFQLSARPLRLLSCNVMASDQRDITLQVTFNQLVDPGEFLRQASFYDGKTSVRLDEPICLTKAPQSDLVIRLQRPESNQFKMIVAPQLAGYGTDVGLVQQIEIKRTVEPGFALINAYVATPDLEQMTSVRLRFSHELGREQQLPALTIEPAVEGVSVHLTDEAIVATGKFKAGERYGIQVPGTLSSQDGKTLGEGTSATIQVPEYEPKIRFEYDRGILSPRGRLAVDARGVNLEQVELQAWRVHANNLVPHLHWTQMEETSQFVQEKIIPVNLPHNEPRKLALDLQGLLAQPLGIYRVQARAVDQRWAQDSIIVTITDLAITAKRQRDGYLVWVTSLRTAEPVTDAAVDGLTYNNQKVVTARTNVNGIAELGFAGRHPDGGIWVITAAKDGDLSYLQPEENEWVIDNVEQRGRPYADNYETMLYTDRGVYRPGETIYLTGIIRDTTGGIASNFPLSIKGYRPDGRQVADLLANRREKDQGLFHTSFTTSGQAQTGSYRFCVTLPGSNDELGSTDALVEAFVPVRMEVMAVPSSERFGPNESLMIRVTGRYLWDQPASDLPVKLEGTIWPTAFDSKAHPDFQFGSGRREPPILLPTTAGQLGQQGQCEMRASLPESLKAGLYNVRLSATVTEPGGRSVSSNTSTVLDLLDTHIGLRLAIGQVIPVGEAVSVDWVRSTGQDQPAAAGEMTMQLIRVEYDTVLKKVDDRYIWQSVEKTENVGASRAMARSGSEGSFDIVCPDSGTYRVAVSDARRGSATCLQFYASRDSGSTESLSMNQPESVEIVTDKKNYLPGEKAKVLLRSPIAGTVLLSVETDSVIAHQIKRIAENTCEFEVSLPEDLRGSAFLTATVVRAVDPNQERWLPHRGLGTAQVMMDHASRRIPVSIEAPAKAQPGETVSVVVDTGHPSDPNQPTLVHLWAVDEGILLAGAYETPDPYEFFLGPRASGVSTADVFYWLLPDYERPSGIARIGADEFDLDALRRSPVPTRVREPAVIWQEAIQTDNEGKVTVQMHLTDLTGQMRIMVVAVDRDRYGAAEHALTLSAPLQVEASWPRFVAPGDRFTVPVKLFNSTEQSLTLQMKTAVSGPIELSMDEGKDFTVPPGRPTTQLLRAKATGIGPVEVKIEAFEQGAAETPLAAHSVAALPVRPATVLHTAVELKAVPAGQQISIEPPDLFLEGTARMTVSVSARPTVELEAALEELIRYPYGCVEQTSSCLLSLLHASHILSPSRAKAVDDMVKAGIARLWSMQTRSGGLSYWPGDATPCLWGTAYAASCLLEAKNAGYEIDSRFTSDLAKFLESKLRVTDEDTPDINTKALICRVLATFREPPYGWMARLAEQRDKLDVAALAHLAGAFYAAGNKEKALSLLPDSPPAMAVATTTTGRLTSQVQQEAVWLSTLLEIEPNHPMTAPLAASLNKARSNGQWGTTLNNAAVIAALSRYQVVTSQDRPQFTGSIQTQAGEVVHFSQEVPASIEIPEAAKPIQVSSSGQGTLYVIATSTGLIRDGRLEPYERRLHVERCWMDRQGKPVDANNLAVGDLVMVEVTVSTTGEAVGNIAVVDALPGGMEVENPRLATSAEIDEATEGRPDYVEFLDDRVVLFCTAESQARTYRYALRAITAGEFALPPVQASCMYDPSVACLGRAGHVTIRGR